MVVQVVELDDVHVLLVFIPQIHEPGSTLMEFAFENDFVGEFGEALVSDEHTSFSKIVFNAQSLQISVDFVRLPEQAGLK